MNERTEMMMGGFKIPEGFVEKPRIDLCEPAFRRFERLIAKGYYETFLFSPREFNMSARTFLARFKDAKRGYRIYKYKSSLIDEKWDVSEVHAVEGTNGMVMIYNRMYRKQSEIIGNMSIPEPIKMEDVSTDMQNRMKEIMEGFQGVNPEDLTPEPIQMSDKDVVEIFRSRLQENWKCYKGSSLELMCGCDKDNEEATKLMQEFPILAKSVMSRKWIGSYRPKK